MKIASYLEEKKVVVEEALNNSIDDPEIPSTLAEAMKYSLLSGGKRLRPILAIAGCEAVGGRQAIALPYAVAVEMVHAFSLVHDDLPAMDNDDLRRGKPTNHKIYGEGMAILVGDGLLIDAFYYLAHKAPKGQEAQFLRVVELLAKGSGSRGMTGGQSLDILSEGKKISLDELQNLHTLKTGRLMTASVVGGAVLGGASKDEVAALQEYGINLGLAFQIMDDILDLVGEEAEIGKPVGSDVSREKNTYPVLLGMDGAKIRAKECIESAIASLNGFPDSARPLRELARYVIERRK